MEVFILNFLVLVFLIFVCVIYILKLNVKCTNKILKATGLSVVVKSNFTFGLPSVKNELAFGKDLLNELPENLRDLRRMSLNNLGDVSNNLFSYDLRAYYTHAHVGRWVETRFGQRFGLFQKFTSNRGNLADVRGFDVRRLGDEGEALTTNYIGNQSIIISPVSIDCDILDKYNFENLTIEKFNELKINLNFLKKYLPDIMCDLENRYGGLIRALENSKDLTEFNAIIVESNTEIVRVVDVSQIASGLLGFREIPVEHILEVAKNIIV